MMGLFQHGNRTGCRAFPGGPVVKDPPAKAEGVGSRPGPGISHVPWAN